MGDRDPSSGISEGEIAKLFEGVELTEEEQKELEAELQFQIQRHERAVALAKQREAEAKAAKDRYVQIVHCKIYLHFITYMCIVSYEQLHNNGYL